MPSKVALSLQAHAQPQPEALMEEPQNRLELDSHLAELSSASHWIEAIADRFGLGDQMRFALHLCIEEALANVVLHGYLNEPGHRILIAFSFAQGTLLFAVEDNAPPFTPLEVVPRVDGNELPSLDSIEAGGNGIRLLRHFAGSLAYERTPDGNRLMIGFPVTLK
jgi:serine/threonine-protein kinase RsbW